MYQLTFGSPVHKNAPGASSSFNGFSQSRLVSSIGVFMLFSHPFLRFVPCRQKENHTHWQRKQKKPKALCLRLRYFGFFLLSEKNFKRPMHTETKDPSLYLCTALSRISDTVNASHHHLRHRHDNCINVSQHALLFLSWFMELKTVFTIALSGKKHNPVFPIFFCRSCPVTPELSMRPAYSSDSPSMQASNFSRKV